MSTMTLMKHLSSYWEVQNANEEGSLLSITLQHSKQIVEITDTLQDGGSLFFIIL